MKKITVTCDECRRDINAYANAIKVSGCDHARQPDRDFCDRHCLIKFYEKNAEAA